MELPVNLDKNYVFADFMKWTTDKIVELFNGAIKMFPTPTATHQHISSNLNILIGYHLMKSDGCGCNIYPAPFTVRFPTKGNDDKDIKYVFQPDLCVICDLSKIQDNKGCLGAPDLIIEIQSKSTASYDLGVKKSAYEKFGVKEYWVVYPYEKGIEVFILQSDGKYAGGVLYDEGLIEIQCLQGCKLDLSDIFR
jgi:Uma2 family endonuclease